MAKIDKSQYTKEEWIRIRDQRRQKKKLETKSCTESNFEEQKQNSNYIVTLKVGTKYSSDYVNRLYDQCKKHLTIPFTFACVTEDPVGINNDVEIVPLELNKNIEGWWYKPFMFDKNFPLKGTLLFLDLDLIVFKNMDRLFTYKPGKFCVIRDFTRHQVSSWKKFNSSIVRVETGQKAHVYDDFISSPSTITKRYRGDQDWLYAQVTEDFEYWPDEWIQSYKWEMRGNPKLVWKSDHKDFEEIGDPKIKPDTFIAVFHGDPKPELCLDPWVRKFWS